MAQKGHHIHFITYQQPVRLSGFIPNIFYHEVQVPTYPLFDYPPYETALASTMVDVIKNHQSAASACALCYSTCISRIYGKTILKQEGIHIPVITTLHGTDITLVGRDKMYAPVVAFSINQSDAITAVSQNLRDETFKTFRIEKPIEVIHNFVDVTRFSRKPIDAFKKLIAPNGERILLHASNFRKIKRVEDVVKIFYNVSKQIPSKLLFVGDGPERATAEELSRQLDICDDVRFVGKQEQMEDILAIADLFILTSEYESFGLAALEAMAAGVPVISTNAGGLGEIMVQGVTGYMANVGDIEALSNFAIDILQFDELLKQFKDNAIKHAALFDIKIIIPKYEQLYDEVLNKELVH